MRPLTPAHLALRWELAQEGLHTHDPKFNSSSQDQTKSGDCPRNLQRYSLHCPTGPQTQASGHQFLPPTTSKSRKIILVVTGIFGNIFILVRVDHRHICIFPILFWWFLFYFKLPNPHSPLSSEVNSHWSPSPIMELVCHINAASQC